MVIYAILAVFNHSVARKDLERNQKNETASCVTDRSVVPIDQLTLQSIWLRGTQKKNIKKEKICQQYLPDRFLWQVGFTLLFFSQNDSNAVPISHSKLAFKACLQNKGVVRRLFVSILILYTSEVS